MAYYNMLILKNSICLYTELPRFQVSMGPQSSEISKILDKPKFMFLCVRDWKLRQTHLQYASYNLLPFITSFKMC